tara:strand:+ start:16 stop:795 length:780 start_codon:yes stop_codon:yes gene_type:complete
MFEFNFLNKYQSLKKYIAFIGTAVSLLYLFFNLDKIAFSSLKLSFTNPYLVSSIVIYSIYLYSRAYFWEHIFNQSKGSYKIYLASQIGKFIPGKIGPSYFRSISLNDKFLNQAKISFWEVIYILIAHSFVAFIFILLKEFSVILLLILILSTKNYRFLILSAFFNYLSFYFLSIYLGNNYFNSFNIVSVLIISSVLALFINIIPFGLGVREGIFLFLYNLFNLDGEISDLIVYSRVISISLEGLIYLFYFFKQRKNFAK